MKKILASEKLSDDELDKVVGDCYDGFADDKKFLRALGFPIGSSSNIGAYQRLFKDCWGKCDVIVRISSKTELESMSGINSHYTKVTHYTQHYFAGGSEIT